MGSRGKRRCDQPADNVSKSVKNNESTKPQSAAQRTLAKNKKKTLPPVNASASGEVRAGTTSTRSSASRPSIPSNFNKLVANGGTNGMKRVMAPPKSRRVSRRTAERISSPITPPARIVTPVAPSISEPAAAGVQLPNSVPRVNQIPESSDDREVYQVPRLPFHENPFYKRYYDDMETANITKGGEVRNNGSPRTDVPSSPGYNNVTSEDEEMDEPVAAASSHPVNVGEQVTPMTPAVLSPGNDVHDLEDLVISREMLSTFHKGIESMLVKEIGDIRQLFCSRLDRFEEAQAKLITEVNELRVIASGGKQSAICQSRSTPLARYEMKLENSTPYAEWVFDMDTISKTLRMNLPHFVISIARERGAFVDKASLAVRAILFGLQPSQRRAVFSSGIGRRHTGFRFSIVMNVICNVQQNRFKRFIRHEAGIGAAAPDTGVRNAESSEKGPVPPLPSGVLQIRQPIWLEPGFIRRKHVEDARQRIENNVAPQDSGSQQNLDKQPSKRAWLTVKDNPSKGDVARFGALKVYRMVTNGLYYGREKAKWVLFEELMYLMIPWDVSACCVDKRNLRMVWGHESPEVHELEISDVPVCRKRGDQHREADEYNTEIMAEFLSARKEMLVCVSHPVKMKPTGNSARNSREAEDRMLQRSINLIDVATKFCVVFTEQAMGEFCMLPFLGAHVDSLRCIYDVSVLFRRVVERFMQEHIDENGYIASEEETPSQIECNGLKFDTLLPAASVRKRLLTGRCLRMTAEEFDRLNCGGSGPGLENHGDGDDDDGDGNILPLGEDGIMLH